MTTAHSALPNQSAKQAASLAPPFDTDGACWTAIMERDPQAEGAFYYAVRTTGVYCRPMCSSKRPRRENVVFYPTREKAERDGFRPCLRCRPNEMCPSKDHVDAVEAACRALDQAAEMLTLADLSAMAGLSPFHFHRLFRSKTGLTPKGYFKARQIQWPWPFLVIV